VNAKRVYNYKTKADMVTPDELQQILSVCKSPQEKAKNTALCFLIQLR
jgi:hypothetical protein